MNRRIAVAIGLAIAAILVYANSFSGPFVFDDQPSIATNLTIRHLTDLWTVLSPPAGETVGGRPLVNLSLALNYAVSGPAVWSYHAFNLLIHILAGLTLFGVLRRTLLRTRFENSARMIAAVVALLWLVHPLQTEAVTYVVQRAESMASLCYLLTLYGVIRAIESPGTIRWKVLATGACFAGVATKEMMVSAPVIALLYDRTFGAGTFRAALRARWDLYLALFSSWLLLVFLVASSGREAAAGVHSGITVASYALTQSRALAQYLMLAVWPHSLVFDYGTRVDTAVSAVLWQVVLVALLLVLVGYAVWKKPRLGFAGVVFMALLAPSSSVVPIATQTVAEHRMYLPLAVVICLVVLALFSAFGRKAFYGCLAWALLLGWRTSVRNRDYQTEVALWRDTATKIPGNPRAQANLGISLVNSGHPQEAVAALRAVVNLDPQYLGAEYNLGRLLAQLGQSQEALEHFERALLTEPDNVRAQYNAGAMLMQAGRLPEAKAHFERVVQTDPSYPKGQAALGEVLFRLGELAAAEEQLLAAVRSDPGDVESHVILGRLFEVSNRKADAVAQFEMALKINPKLEAVRAHLEKMKDGR